MLRRARGEVVVVAPTNKDCSITLNRDGLRKDYINLQLLPASLEDEDLGHAVELGEVIVIEVVDDG